MKVEPSCWFLENLQATVNQKLSNVDYRKVLFTTDVGCLMRIEHLWS